MSRSLLSMFGRWKTHFTAPNCPRPLAVAAVLLAAIYVLPFGLLPWLQGPSDFNHLATYYELAWRYWVEDPGLPGFNPYFCGGRTLAADPQVPVFHPLLFLVALLGPVWTLKWEMLAALALGIWGLWRWLARWKVAAAGRMWGCLLFASGGFIVARYMVGHVTLGFYAIAPLYFYLSYRLCDRHPPRRVGVAFFALILYCTLYKPNFLIYALPPLLFEASVRSLLQRRWRPLLALTGAVALSGLAAGVNLLPASHYFGEFPRTADANPKQVPLYALLANLLVPLKAVPSAWYGPDFMQRHEYSVFLGPVALFFALRAVAPLWPQHAERLSLLLFGIFSAVLGLGFDGTLSWRPYSWFHSFWPGFQSVRAPVRLWFGAYLALVVFSSLGFSWPRRRIHQACIVLLGIVPLLGGAFINLGKVVWFAPGPQWRPARAFPDRILQKHTHPDTPYTFIRQGQAVIECVENMEAFRSPRLTEGDLLNPLAPAPLSFAAKWNGWSRIEIEGHATEAVPVTLNLNHHPYWYWRGRGATLISQTGDPLTLRVEKGFQGELAFEDPSLIEGSLLSLVTIAVLLVLGIRLWRRSRQPLRVGLTGGIGSGKSTVAKRLLELGWWVVDLDTEARQLTDADPRIHASLREIFGAGIFLADGKLDRKALRYVVFRDPALRRKLERLLHARLMRAYNARCREASRSGIPAVVCDAALLVETGYNRKLDRTIVVTTPLEIRRDRLRRRDGLPEETLSAILASQFPDGDKITAADYVISNHGSVAELLRETDRVAKQILGARHEPL